MLLHLVNVKKTKISKDNKVPGHNQTVFVAQSDETFNLRHIQNLKKR